MSVVIAGTVALDNVKTPQDAQENLLGGSASYAALAASIFCQPIHLVGVIGHDFPKPHLDMLSQRGITLEGLERSSGAAARDRSFRAPCVSGTSPPPRNLGSSHTWANFGGHGVPATCRCDSVARGRAPAR